MRVGITGSWKEKHRQDWALDSDFETFKTACHALGSAMAESGAEITVGSDSGSTADKYAVEGYLACHTASPRVRVIKPRKARTPFPDLYKRYPEAFVYVPSVADTWRHTRQQFVVDIDAMVTVGGGDGTYQAGLEIRLTRKRLVPVGAFGGASSRLLNELLSSPGIRTSDFERLASPWSSKSASHVAAVVGANRPSRVLLIHGHAKDRIALDRWLKRQDLAEPLILHQQFALGRTIPEKFEQYADEADAAIALATPDDLASSLAKADLVRRRARQNVWVEVGWFWGRLGRSRVLLLVRGNVEIPSDLEAIEHYVYQKSPVEREAEIKQFLLAASQRNQ